jgi:DNA-directed RNA polymerase specialized sigma24 family protein
LKPGLLSDREALVIQLHYADGWSLRRIARGIGCHERSVRRAHASALVHLRACCAADEGPFDAQSAAVELLSI